MGTYQDSKEKKKVLYAPAERETPARLAVSLSKPSWSYTNTNTRNSGVFGLAGNLRHSRLQCTASIVGAVPGYTVTYLVHT